MNEKKYSRNKKREKKDANEKAIAGYLESMNTESRVFETKWFLVYIRKAR